MKYSFEHNTQGQRIALDVCKIRGYGALNPCRQCSYYKKKRFCPKLRAEKMAHKEEAQHDD